MENKYWKTKMYQTILIILLIGSLNWGTTALGYNFVEIIKNLLNNSLKTETYIDKIIYFLVALAGITLAMNRELWSPCIEDFRNNRRPPPRPSPPILLTAIPGDRSVQLSWSASTHATSYKIKGVDQSNNPLFRDANNLSYTVTGLTNGRSYSFIVVGKNSAGESGDLSANRMGPIIPSVPILLSAAPTQVTPILPSAALAPGPYVGPGPSAAPIEPSPPLNVRADILNDMATISWTKPTVSVGITGYIINQEMELNNQIIPSPPIIVQGENTLSAIMYIIPAYTYTISVSALYQGGPSTGGPAVPLIRLPQMYIIPGVYTEDFVVTLRFFNNAGEYNPSARLLVDTNPPEGGGRFTWITDYNQSVTESNNPPDSTLVGANALGGAPLLYTNDSLGIIQGIARSLRITGYTPFDRSVIIKLIDNNNTITRTVQVRPRQLEDPYGEGYNTIY
jgi:uncharacterized membrane protein YuzA (DUF378 family)